MKKGIIVEDESAVRTAYGRYCERYVANLRLSRPASLEELAWLLDADERYDLLVLDSDLKKGWGEVRPFCEHELFPALIRRLNPVSLVISTSGRSEAGRHLCDRATALGATCVYIGKPDMSGLKQALCAIP